MNCKYQKKDSGMYICHRKSDTKTCLMACQHMEQDELTPPYICKSCGQVLSTTESLEVLREAVNRWLVDGFDAAEAVELLGGGE